MEQRVILTPVDFTEVSEFAIDHSMHLAGSTGAELHLLHIVKDSNAIKEAKEKLEAIIEKLKAEDGAPVIKAIIRIGDIYHDISNAAVENGANLIVMGTHGLKGFQFITGSRALKVVGDSEIPFLIVQKDTPKFENYKHIFVPLSLEKDTKQKLSYVATIAKYFDSKVYLTVPQENDEFLRNKLTRDLKYSEQYFREQGIDYDAQVFGNKNDVETYLEFAAQNEIDLFVIMNHREGILPAISNNVQEIITNKDKIPTLLINPRITSNISILGNYMGAG